MISKGRSYLPAAENARVAVLGSRDGFSSALVDCLRASHHVPTTPDSTASKIPLEPTLTDYDVVFLTLRWTHLVEEAPQLQNLLSNVIVVACTTSLDRDEDGFFIQRLASPSVTELTAALLPGSRVVGALHPFSAEHLELAKLGLLQSDVPIVGDDREAADFVAGIIERVHGFEAVHMGGLQNAAAVEGLAAVVAEVGRRGPTPLGFRLNEAGAGGLRFLY